MQTKTGSLTRILLLCGAIAGPLFILAVLIQDYTRPAFNPRLQPLSLLSLGAWGWVQITNFVLAGVLTSSTQAACGGGCTLAGPEPGDRC
jgi:Protein of unknown function (DUF998)